MTSLLVGARCTSAEELDLGEYLRRTPVARLGDQLIHGRAGAWHAKILDRETLGASSTIFGELGAARAPDKFLVREVLPTVGAPTRPDELLRRTVESMIAAELEGTLEDRVLTLFDDGSRAALLVDGNKRAIAIYEAAVATYPIAVLVVRRI